MPAHISLSKNEMKYFAYLDTKLTPFGNIEVQELMKDKAIRVFHLFCALGISTVDTNTTGGDDTICFLSSLRSRVT